MKIIQKQRKVEKEKKIVNVEAKEQPKVKQSVEHDPICLALQKTDKIIIFCSNKKKILSAVLMLKNSKNIYERIEVMSELKSVDFEFQYQPNISRLYQFKVLFETKEKSYESFCEIQYISKFENEKFLLSNLQKRGNKVTFNLNTQSKKKYIETITESDIANKYSAITKENKSLDDVLFGFSVEKFDINTGEKTFIYAGTDGIVLDENFENDCIYQVRLLKRAIVTMFSESYITIDNREINARKYFYPTVEAGMIKNEKHQKVKQLNAENELVNELLDGATSQTEYFVVRK